MIYLSHQSKTTHRLQHNSINQEVIILNKSIIIKSLINGVVSYFLVALVLTLIKGQPFGQALTAPYTIFPGVAALVGSVIGFWRKENKK